MYIVRVNIFCLKTEPIYLIGFWNRTFSWFISQHFADEEWTPLTKREQRSESSSFCVSFHWRYEFMFYFCARIHLLYTKKIHRCFLLQRVSNNHYRYGRKAKNWRWKLFNRTKYCCQNNDLRCATISLYNLWELPLLLLLSSRPVLKCFVFFFISVDRCVLWSI